MTALTLTIQQLAAIVGGAVLLAVTNPAAINDIALAAIAKRLGVSATDVRNYDAATGENTTTTTQQDNENSETTESAQTATSSDSHSSVSAGQSTGQTGAQEVV